MNSHSVRRAKLPDAPEYMCEGFAAKVPPFLDVSPRGEIKPATKSSRLPYPAKGNHLVMCIPVDLTANPVMKEYFRMFVKDESVTGTYSWREFIRQAGLDVMSLYCAGRNRNVKCARAAAEYADWHLACLMACISLHSSADKRAEMINAMQRKLSRHSKLTAECFHCASKALETAPEIIAKMKRASGKQMENPAL